MDDILDESETAKASSGASNNAGGATNSLSSIYPSSRTSSRHLLATMPATPAISRASSSTAVIVRNDDEMAFSSSLENRDKSIIYLNAARSPSIASLHITPSAAITATNQRDMQLDLSHLSLEEREAIKNVIDRDRCEQNTQVHFGLELLRPLLYYS